MEFACGTSRCCWIALSYLMEISVRLRCAPTLFYHCTCVYQAGAAVAGGETAPGGKGTYMRNKHECWMKRGLFLANNTWKLNRALSCPVTLGVGCCCPSRVVCCVFPTYHHHIQLLFWLGWEPTPPLPPPPSQYTWSLHLFPLMAYSVVSVLTIWFWIVSIQPLGGSMGELYRFSPPHGHTSSQVSRRMSLDWKQCDRTLPGFSDLD